MLISVITPAYNEERYISDAIDSVQKYSGIHEIEHIIIDDLSTDNTYKVAKEKSLKICVPVTVLQTPLKGKINALNYGFKKSRGDVFILFGGDDLICAESIDQRVEPFIESGQPMITRAALKTFFETPENLGRRSPLKGGGNKSGGAVAMNRKFLDFYSPIPSILPNEDTWLQAIAVASDCEVVDVNVTALMFRVHSGNSWNRRSGFDDYNREITIRNEAYRIAMEKFSDTNPEASRRLSKYWSAELHRRNSHVLGLLFSSIPLSDKKHFLFSSHERLYVVKKFINSLIVSSS